MWNILPKRNRWAIFACQMNTINNRMPFDSNKRVKKQKDSETHTLILNYIPNDWFSRIQDSFKPAKTRRIVSSFFSFSLLFQRFFILFEMTLVFHFVSVFWKVTMKLFKKIWRKDYPKSERKKPSKMREKRWAAMWTPNENKISQAENSFHAFCPLCVVCFGSIHSTLFVCEWNLL